MTKKPQPGTKVVCDEGPWKGLVGVVDARKCGDNTVKVAYCFLGRHNAHTTDVSHVTDVSIYDKVEEDDAKS